MLRTQVHLPNRHQRLSDHHLNCNIKRILKIQIRVVAAKKNVPVLKRAKARKDALVTKAVTVGMKAVTVGTKALHVRKIVLQAKVVKARLTKAAKVGIKAGRAKRTVLVTEEKKAKWQKAKVKINTEKARSSVLVKKVMTERWSKLKKAVPVTNVVKVKKRVPVIKEVTEKMKLKKKTRVKKIKHHIQNVTNVKRKKTVERVVKEAKGAKMMARKWMIVQRRDQNVPKRRTKEVVSISAQILKPLQMKNQIAEV